MTTANGFMQNYFSFPWAHIFMILCFWIRALTSKYPTPDCMNIVRWYVMPYQYYKIWSIDKKNTVFRRRSVPIRSIRMLFCSVGRYIYAVGIDVDVGPSTLGRVTHLFRKLKKLNVRWGEKIWKKSVNNRPRMFVSHAHISRNLRTGCFCKFKKIISIRKKKWSCRLCAYHYRLVCTAFYA